MIRLSDDVYMAPDLIESVITKQALIGCTFFVEVFIRDEKTKTSMGGVFPFTPGDTASFVSARNAARARAAAIANEVREQTKRN